VPRGAPDQPGGLSQGGACGAAGPASAAGSALTARPPHAGPHRITPNDQPGSLNTRAVLDAAVFFDSSCLARRARQSQPCGSFAGAIRYIQSDRDGP